MAENEHTGSETIGAAGERGKMTLFRDDRAEDLGSILVAVLVVATVIVLTVFKAPAKPAGPVSVPPAAGAPASGGAPAR
jgi:hypothetical protein